jgi:hypothetical protein
MAFPWSDDDGEFYLMVITFGFAYGALATLILFSQHPIALIVWIVLVVASSLAVGCAEEKTVSLMRIFYIAWVSTGLVILAGHFGYVPHYELIALQIPLDLGLLRTIVDVRYIMTALFALSLGCSALYHALSSDAPTLPHLPPFSPIKLTVGIDVVDALLLPFLVAATVMLKTLHLVADIVWVVVATLAVYLCRISVRLANHLIELVTSQRIWKPLGRLYASYVIVYAACMAIRTWSPDAQHYVFTSPPGLTTYLPGVLIPSGIALFAVVLHCAVWSLDVLGAVARVALAAALLVIAFACSGMLLCLLRVLGVVGIRGYDGVGPVSLGILIILGAIFCVYVIGSLTKIDAFQRWK